MKWFFKKRDPSRPAEFMALTDNRVEQLRKFRDVGQEFNYLGRRMVVTQLGDSVHRRTLPILFADYADDSGRIRQARFHFRELAALKGQNPEMVRA